jgi:hypothetical protein
VVERIDLSLLAELPEVTLVVFYHPLIGIKNIPMPPLLIKEGSCFLRYPAPIVKFLAE